MELTITPRAAAWYEDELMLSKGESVRIYGKYGGATNVHVGFSTGIEVTAPHEPLINKEINGITYFTEAGDDWFFADYHLVVDLDDTLNEPMYTYN